MHILLPDIADSYYGTSYLPGPNGSEGVMHCGGWGAHYYSFMQFDLTNVPRAELIKNAILYLYETGTNTISPVPRIYRITSSWSEATLARSLVPTYDSATFYTFSPAWTNAVGWKTCDITALIRQWKNGTYPNYGMSLRDAANSPNSDSQIATKENADPTLAPYIDINTFVPKSLGLR